ncbi:DUF488 family protein [Candidatus Planktophila dulcis]|uniref:DUF488 family protein, N3 subclade n=1 Tax=Candidatus Planktophila dulcis TaxID=1884914 RepID=UPI003BEEE5DE
MEICTSGTSGISAERFFIRLREAGITSIIDTRIHPASQLAGYAKQDSLIFFAKELLNVQYIHEPLLCPDAEILKSYRSKLLNWAQYQQEYLELLIARELKFNLDTNKWGERPLLLCSEELPDNCHRKLAAEFLKDVLPYFTEIRHL